MRLLAKITNGPRLFDNQMWNETGTRLRVSCLQCGDQEENAIRPNKFCEKDKQTENSETEAFQ